MPKKPSKADQTAALAASINPLIGEEVAENPKIITGILKAIEILEARIRYNTALLNFLQEATDIKIMEFADKFIAPKIVLTTFLNTANAKQMREELDSLNAIKIRQELITGTNNDIEMLKNILKHFKNTLTDKNQTLYAIMHTQIAITNEEQSNNTAAGTFDIVIKNCTTVVAKLSKEKRHHPQNVNIDVELKQAKERLATITKAKDDYFKTNPDKNEAPALKQLLHILDQFEVLDKSDRDFFDKYAKIIIVNGCILCDTTPEYKRLEVRNSELIQKMLLDLERKFGNLYLSETLANKIRDHNANWIKHIMPKGAPIERFIACYRYQHGLAKSIKIFQEEYEEAIIEEQKWLAEQEKILVAEKLAEQQRLKAISEAKAEEKQRLEAEQKLQVERNKVADHERKAQHKLDLHKQREDRARIKIEKEQQRLSKKHQHVVERIKIETNDDSQQLISSKYIVPIELIIENREALQNLFDPKTKTFRYRDADILIRRLGGRIDKSTGSSHQCVIFNDALYQQIDFEHEVGSPRANTVKSGIARPHAGETELRHFNLELFRDSIRCILPKNWDLDPKPKSAVTPKSP